ncbi:MAG: SLC13 family permease [Spirochaetales bacterium]|nr:SLC13 family permease [Spirochaetales bacterium]
MMDTLTLEGWLALGTTVAVLALLASNRVPPDLALLAGAVFLVGVGVISPEVALRGFSNEGMLTVAVLFVVAFAVQRTGALSLVARPLLGQPGSLRGALLRLCTSSGALSGFINNTPLVAMMLPLVSGWARQLKISPSKLLLPLSYATVLGGMLTMIGTSTNLVVSGLLEESGRGSLGFFVPTLLGLVLVVVGVLVIVIFAPLIVPDRVNVDGTFSDPRRFTVEVLVEEEGPFVGQPVSALREHAGGMNPVEIDRGDDQIPAPGPDVLLRAGDRLVLAGPALAIAALGQIRGLRPAADLSFGGESSRRHLFEVIVSDRSPLVGEQVGTGVFRRRYGGAIVAVARHGETLAAMRNADWSLRPGDALLVEAGSNFMEHPDVQSDFWTLREHGPARRNWRTWAALGITASMCVAAASGLMPMLWAALVAALVIAGTGIITIREVRSSIDLQIVIAIASSFALGSALETTGAAAQLARLLAGLGGQNPWLALAMIYLSTAVATELITNNAAAALLLPVGLATADTLGVAWMPFAMAVMFAASSSFVTPIGYATNLMVWGPGGYTFGDFLRLGGLLWLAVAALSVALIPVLWPF